MQRFALIEDEGDLLLSFECRKRGNAIITNSRQFQQLPQGRGRWMRNEEFAQLQLEFARLFLK